MPGSEERKQVLIKWDSYGADHDAHRERADHEESQEPEPGAAGSSQRGTTQTLYVVLHITQEIRRPDVPGN